MSIKRKILRLLPDALYLKIRYRKKCGKKLNLKEPKDYNDKLNWLKLHDHNPEYTKMVDKATSKEWATSIIGEGHVIPTIGVYKKSSDIDFSALPSKFVLKCTHDSGTVFVCTDKEKFDISGACAKLDKALKENYFYFGREWAYKNIEPQIIAEEYMADESGTELKDYKVFCFDGEPKMIEVIYGRYSKKGCNLYTPKWEYLHGESVHFPSDESVQIEKPQKLEEMMSMARKLSAGIPHVRVDFYIANDTVIFGEMTFFHSNGFGGFRPDEFNRMLGDWIEIKKN